MGDILLDFILESRKDLSKYNIDSTKYMLSTITENYMTITPASVDFSNHDRTLNQAMSNLEDSVSGISKLEDFFRKVYNSPLLDDQNLSIKIRLDDGIDMIRPEYFNTIPKDFAERLKKIVDTSKTISVQEIDSDITDYFNSMSKKIVKTSKNVYQSKDLITPPLYELVIVTKPFLVSDAIPFCAKMNGEVQNMDKLVKSVKIAMHDGSDKINRVAEAILKEIDKDDEEGDNTVNTRIIRYFITLYSREYIKLSSLITALTVRKVTNLMSRITAFDDLHSRIQSFFPEGEYVLHEAVIDDTIDDAEEIDLVNSMIHHKCDLLTSYLDKLIEKRKSQISLSLASQFKMKFDITKLSNTIEKTMDYDDTLITKMRGIPSLIIDKVKHFTSLIPNEELSCADMVKTSELTTDVINNMDTTFIRDLSIYTDNSLISEHDRDTNIKLLQELESLRNGLPSLAEKFSELFREVDGLLIDIEYGSKLTDNIRKEDIHAFILVFKKDIKMLTLRVMEELILRIKNIREAFNFDNITWIGDIEGEMIPDYTDTDKVLKEYEDIELNENEEINSIMSEYHKYRVNKQTGSKVIYKEDLFTPHVYGGRYTI